jgi:hypothetical protein
MVLHTIIPENIFDIENYKQNVNGSKLKCHLTIFFQARRTSRNSEEESYRNGSETKASSRLVSL